MALGLTLLNLPHDVNISEIIVTFHVETEILQCCLQILLVLLRSVTTTEVKGGEEILENSKSNIFMFSHFVTTLYFKLQNRVNKLTTLDL